jgi:hypothetical protein
MVLGNSGEMDKEHEMMTFSDDDNIFEPPAIVKPDHSQIGINGFMIRHKLERLSDEDIKPPPVARAGLSFID